MNLILVLSRNKGEQIYIDDDIVLTVVQIRDDRVRIGIDAPKDVPVHRKEIYDTIKKTNTIQIHHNNGDKALEY